MKIRSLPISLLVCLGLLLGTGQQPVSASTPPEDICTTVDFFIYNALDETVMIDLVNWTTGTRWLNPLESLHSTRFTMLEGVFEFYIDNLTGQYWYISVGDSFQDCNRVAVYIKQVQGVPALRIKEAVAR